MWLFTPLGFYSVVNNNVPKKKGVLIRARNRGHLDRLCKFLNLELDRVLVTPNNDYRFRIEATYKEFDKAMYLLAALPAGYGNFKGECSLRATKGELDPEYVKALSKVWHTMFDYQNGPPAYRGDDV